MYVNALTYICGQQADVEAFEGCSDATVILVLLEIFLRNVFFVNVVCLL